MIVKVGNDVSGPKSSRGHEEELPWGGCLLVCSSSWP